MALAQTRGDAAELGVRAGGVHHPDPVAGADDGAHERQVGRIGQRRIRPSPAAVDFSDADDSPVRMLSSHSSPLTSISRTSAGTTSPSVTGHVARHQLGHVDPAEFPVRRTTARVAHLRMQRLGGRSARYSLTKPSPMLAARMTPMIIAWVLSPRKYETTAVTAAAPAPRCAADGPARRTH